MASPPSEVLPQAEICGGERDPAEIGLVQEVGVGRLADLQDRPVREQRRRARPQVQVARVVARPRRGGEELGTGQARRQLQDRVAEVVRQSTTTRSPWPPRCCPPSRPRARRRPSTRPRRGRSAPPGSSAASRRPRAPSRPSRCRSSSHRRCRRSRRRRCRCSGSDRCVAGWRPGPVPAGRRPRRGRRSRCTCSTPRGNGRARRPPARRPRRRSPPDPRPRPGCR